MAQVPEHDTEDAAQLLTAKQVAKALGLTSDETVNRWARLGKIKHIDLPSGHRRFRPEVVQAILDGRRGGAA